MEVDQMIASLEGQDDQDSMFFVYGGSFNPGDSSDNGGSSNSAELGKIIEYKMRANKPSKELPETVKSDAQNFDQNKPLQIDSLLEELKRNREMRQKASSSTRRKNDVSPINREMHNEAELTNIRIGNLPSFVQATLLAADFSCYGPIVRTKIMIPPKEESTIEPSAAGLHRRTCGFVQFQYREDAERAKYERDGTLFHGSVINIDWSKPTENWNSKSAKKFGGSVYEPKYSKQSSSRSFSHSQGARTANQVVDQTNLSLEKKLSMIPRKAPYDIVVPPPFIQARYEIDSFAETVFKNGPEVEQRAREQVSNPLFSFLHLPASPAGIYYRWRIAEFHRGGSLFHWNEVPFEEFQGGRWLIPPFQTSRNTVSDEDRAEMLDDNSGDQAEFDHIPFHLSCQGESLSNEDRSKWTQVLQTIGLSKAEINQGMKFALEHSENIPEICEILTESLLILETKLTMKLARLYLVSDILVNAAVLAAMVDSGRVSSLVENCSTISSLYISCLYNTLPKIFQSLGTRFKSIPGRISAQSFKDHVSKVWTAWSKYHVFTNVYISHLKDKFEHPDNEDSPLLPRPPEPKVTSIQIKSDSSRSDASKSTVYPSNKSNVSNKKENVHDSHDIDGFPVKHLNGILIKDILEKEIQSFVQS